MFKSFYSFIRRRIFFQQRKPIITNQIQEPRNNSIVMLVPDDRIDRRVLLEARSLSKEGWTVTVIAAPPPFAGYHDDEDCFPEINIVRIDTNSFVSIPVELIKYSSRLKRDWKEFYWYHNHFLIEAMKHPATIYVAHDLPVLPAAAIAAEHFESYLVYDSHELYPEQHHFGSERIELYSNAEKILAPLADKIITVNESIAKEMSKRYNIELPNIILNCPEMDVSNFPDSSSNNILRNNLGIDPNSMILLFQGSISLNRNLENLVSAMRLVNKEDIVLVIMGPGDQKREELKNLAKKYNMLNTKVFFHPPVQQKDLLRYTASADVGIIPYPHIDLNSYFCTPNKLFEFMVAGVPILANESPELKRFVEGQEIGINMPMKNENDIAEAINKFFLNDLKVFHENLKKIRNNFIWQVEGCKLVQFYNEMLKKNSKVKEGDNKCAE